MAIVINGSGTVTGLAVGGLPDGIVDAGTLASNAVTEAKIASSAVVTAKLNDDAVTNAKIANDAITEHELAGGAVVTAAINDDAVTGSKVAAGAVIQVVATVLGSTFAFTGGATWTNTGVVAAITPSSTSSKILIMPSLALGMSVSAVNVRLRCLRSVSGGADTVVGSPTGGGDCFSHKEQNQSGNLYTRYLESTNILDSPNTTSVVTYYVQIYRNTTAGTAYLNRGDADQSRQHSTITLMEIAG